MRSSTLQSIREEALIRRKGGGPTSAHVLQDCPSHLAKSNDDVTHGRGDGFDAFIEGAGGRVLDGQVR